MASNPPAQCCTIGIKHDGIPTGRMVKVGSHWDAYLAIPPADANKVHHGTAVLYLPDVIGIWQNSKLMADQFAANGYQCLVVDILNGDPVPLNRPPVFDMKQWMAQGSDRNNPHTKAAIDPIVQAAVAYLKEKLGVKRIGAVGYCFGAKYVARHYSTGIDVGYMAHPSFVEESELSSISGPLSISTAETDPIFPAEKRHQSEKILATTGQPYQITLFSGVSHGFAVRCDPTKKLERFAKEQAFLQAVAWFDEHL